MHQPGHASASTKTRDGLTRVRPVPDAEQRRGNGQPVRHQYLDHLAVRQVRPQIRWPQPIDETDSQRRPPRWTPARSAARARGRRRPDTGGTPSPSNCTYNSASTGCCSAAESCPSAPRSSSDRALPRRCSRSGRPAQRRKSRFCTRSGTAQLLRPRGAHPHRDRDGRSGSGRQFPDQPGCLVAQRLSAGSQM